MNRVGAVAFLMAGLLLLPAVARAQEAAEEEAEEAAQTEGAAETEATNEGEAPVDDDAAAFLAGEEEQPLIEAPAEERGIGWDEPADMRFWMVGARWRLIMVPAWLLDAFFDFLSPTQEPRNVTVNQSVGVEFTTRKNNFSIVGGVWWAGYFTQSDDDGWFVAEESGQTDDPEFIRSRISLMMFTVDFLYSPMFTDWFGIYVGGGLGFGINLASEDDGTGNAGTGLYRHEATSTTTGGPYDRCGAPSGGLCESDGYYYPGQDSRVWRAYPWIDILVGLRFKAFRHLEINVDGGVGLGFLFGMRVNYIF